MALSENSLPVFFHHHLNLRARSSGSFPQRAWHGPQVAMCWRWLYPRQVIHSSCSSDVANLLPPWQEGQVQYIFPGVEDADEVKVLHAS